MTRTPTTLAKVCHPPQYGANAKGSTKALGPRFVRQTDLNDGRIDWSTVPYCDLPQAEVGKYAIATGDLLISRLGNGVGNAAIVKESKAAVFAGYLVRFRTIDEVADPRFIAYHLQSPGWRTHVSNFGSGAAQPTLNAKQMGEYTFELPPLAEQQRISDVLGSLDDKIDSNRRIQELLDSLFQSLWRDFYLSAMDREKVRLSEVVTTQYGLNASADFDPVGPKFLRVTDINKANWIDWSDVPFVSIQEGEHQKYALQKGDLVVARMADPGKSAIFEDESVDAVFAGYLVRLVPQSYEASLFIYGFLKSPEFTHFAQGTSSGSVQKNMNAKVIASASLHWPEASAIQEFATKVMPIRDRLIASLAETSKLKSLRDTLLPELLSGRINVAEV